ncbi:hypothetical protein OKW51_003713 [Pseudomonas hunanensis]|nr:hypothetical protein [Pseudomonas hunanensis]
MDRTHSFLDMLVKLSIVAINVTHALYVLQELQLHCSV